MINKIHYAVEIVTDYNQPIPSIGMIEAGIIRYVTDNIDTTNGYVYESGAPVEEYNTTLLTVKGISTSAQKIDIIAGGDFAYNASNNITIANVGALHKKILQTEGLYIVGSKMTMYVIIDGVFYKRWSGVVGEYSFDEKTFTFKGVDKHKIGNNVIEADTGVGYTYVSADVIKEDIEVIVEDCFIKKIDQTNAVLDYTYEGKRNDNHYPLNDVDIESYCGNNKYSVKKVNYNTNNGYCIVLNGWYEDVIKPKMTLKFVNDDQFYSIVDIYNYIEVYNNDDGNQIHSTHVWIDKLPKLFLDTTQLYGVQEYVINNSVKDDCNTSSGSVVVSVYDNKITLPDQNYVIKDGKYVAVDDECNEVLLEKNSDGTISLETEYEVVTLPKKVYYFSEPSYSAFNVELDNGTVTHLQWKYTDVTDEIPQSLDTSSDSFNRDINRYYYFIAEYEGELDAQQPFVIVDSMIKDSWQNWIPYNYQGGNAYDSYLYDTGASYDDRVGTIDKPWVPSDLKMDYKEAVASFFRQYTITLYAIIYDKERGEIPLLLGDFTLPNFRVATNKEGYSNSTGDEKYKVLGMTVNSIPSTNLSKNSVVSESITSAKDKLLNWVNVNDGATTANEVRFYMNGSIDWFLDELTLNGDVTYLNNGTTKLMYRIEPNNDIGDFINEPGTLLSVPGQNAVFAKLGVQTGWYDIHGDTITPTKAIVGLNTIGVFKTVNLDLNNIKLKVKPEPGVSTGHYPDLLRMYADSISPLPNKDKWAVGKFYPNEVNTFDEVTKLCKQGFTAGFSDRNGDVILSDFLYKDRPETHDHDDYLILDKSLKAFKLTPLSKCFNDFTIKYDYRCGDYQGELGVHNVYEDEFPGTYTEPEDKVPVTDEYYPAGIVKNFTIWTEGSHPCAYVGEVYTMGIERDVAWPEVPKGKFAYIELNDGEYAIAEINDWCSGSYRTCNYIYYSGTLPSAGDIYSTTYDTDNMYLFETLEEAEGWKEFVVGIDSYAEAKDIWIMARESYLLNKVIRKATSDRSNLEYAIDLDKFNGTDTGIGKSYAVDYFKMFVAWSTRQKLQVSYNIPITVDTVKVNLIDGVLFKDAIILPEANEFGKGWITMVKLDPNRDVLNVEITFEPDFFVPRHVGCSTITETGYAVDDIIETGNNTDTITEGEC